MDTLEKQKPGVGHVLPLFDSLWDGHLSKMDIFACSASPNDVWFPKEAQLQK